MYLPDSRSGAERHCAAQHRYPHPCPGDDAGQYLWLPLCPSLRTLRLDTDGDHLCDYVDCGGTTYARYSYTRLECSPYRLVRFFWWGGLWFCNGLEFVCSRLQCEPAGEDVGGAHLLAHLSGRLHPLCAVGNAGDGSDVLEAAWWRRTAGGYPDSSGRLRLLPDCAAGAERDCQQHSQ